MHRQALNQTDLDACLYSDRMYVHKSSQTYEKSMPPRYPQGTSAPPSLLSTAPLTDSVPHVHPLLCMLKRAEALRWVQVTKKAGSSADKQNSALFVMQLLSRPMQEHTRQGATTTPCCEVNS